jgi:hypothetical protein
VGKSIGKRPFGKSRSRQENNIKADFRDIDSENGRYEFVVGTNLGSC